MNSTTVCCVEHPKKNSVDTLTGIIGWCPNRKPLATKRQQKESNDLREAGCCLWTRSKTFFEDGSLRASAIETGNKGLFLRSSGSKK